jgi:ssDNA-binding Zn-finger/Zn-ribbon topoisomerase 1
MVQTWSTADKGIERCPNCGTRYRKRVTRLPVRDKDYFDCNVCNHRMDEWNSTHVPMYEQLPEEDDASAAKPAS